jgi:hypothetical protein
MGQFKPMVKMETTEPSVILKLKKGGHVAMKSKGENGHAPMKKMDGGAMAAMAGTPALIGRPALNAPVRAPKRPSMAARRAAMMAAQRPRMAPPAGGLPVMKKGGKAEGGDMDKAQDKSMIKKAFKQHDMQEHKGGKGTKLALKKGGKMATGGVPMGAGGFKKGGAAKKFADGGPTSLGSVVGSGAFTPAEGTIPRGGGPTPGGIGGGDGGGAYGGLDRVYGGAGAIGDSLASIAKSSDATKAALGGSGGGKTFMDQMFKKGGKVSKKFADGGRVNSGRAVSMPQGHKKPTPSVATKLVAGTFKNGGNVKRLNSGSDAQSVKETKGYKGTYTTQRDENLDDLRDMNPMTYIRPLVRPLVSKVKGLFGSSDAPGAITKTKESTTIVPKKRSGGMANC